MLSAAILETLPAPQRLALAYGPRSSSGVAGVLLGFDAQLAGIVRRTSEPILGQMRLAWWRDLLAKPSSERPSGQPLIAVLDDWSGEEAVLGGLVDAWEGLLAEPPLAAEAFEQLAEARARGWATVARLSGAKGEAAEAERAGRNWALIDLAGHLGDPAERDCATRLAAGQDWRRPLLGRALRPLAVLHGLSRRAVRRGSSDLLAGPLDLCAAVRIGMAGV